MRDELPLEEALNQLNRQMMVINTLAAEINQSLDLEKILNYSLDKTIEITGADFAGVLLVSGDQKLIPKVLKGVPSERVREIQEHRLILYRGLEEQVIRSKQSVIVEDLTKEVEGYKVKNIFESLQISSYLGVPILSLDKVWGVISIGSREKGYFTRRDVEFLSILAHHIGIAVKSARHHQREKELSLRKQAAEKLRRQNDYLAALHETTLALMNRLELHDLLEVIITRAGELLGTQHGYVHLLGSKGTEMIVGIGIYSQRIDYGVRPGKGLVGKIWQTGQPLVVDNYSTWPERLPDPQLDSVRAQIGIPLKSGSEVVGVIGLAYLEEGRTFGDDEIALLGQFAELASIALDNARLYTAVQQELAERKRAEEALRKSEERLQAILDNSPAVIYVKDTRYRYLLVNRRYETLTHLSREHIAGKTDYELFPKEIADAFRVNDEKVLTARTSLEFEEICLQDDGPHTYISIKFPLFDALGVPYGICGISTDITERKKLEEQFRQSQKMEAIGRLAGGVAHDFNNLLTIIMGYNDLLLRQISHLDPIRKDLEEIKKAGERAISLTRQLLAFSRKQILQPQVLNLNVILTDMNKMLRRLIGEDIDLIIIPDPTLGSVKADPGQIEQVIMNLAVNARDAMPQGGRLIIETANVELDETYAHGHMGVQAGPYVMLAVSDTGSGIDKETQSRLFEPFFTTKEQGKGTGLGLSTVYGIVKQSGGNIWVYSEPGQGTTFKVYLPRVEEVVKTLKPDVTPLEPSRVFETILVVEDEKMVRDLICRILRRNGYTVLEAQHGSEALLVCEQRTGPIHLMMTDVVMPGMSGRELAERLTPSHPEMKILYMSGYTDNTVVYHGVLAAGTAFLQKPFTPDVLLNKVREVLDRSQEKPGPTCE
ncbi:MAG TPA: GAF domain-containing protein [Candidatus Limnocylindrales bacterium]|nr:GAF domain-containing protein [Candidatus Limnocylindrales bacterium]